MVKEILLNDRSITVEEYKEEKVNDSYKISVVFNVSSDEYHDISTLLYEGSFDVQVPERKLSFRANISEYYTSITNLYEKGNVGLYHLSLMEAIKGDIDA